MELDRTRRLEAEKKALEQIRAAIAHRIAFDRLEVTAGHTVTLRSPSESEEGRWWETEHTVTAEDVAEANRIAKELGAF